MLSYYLHSSQQTWGLIIFISQIQKTRSREGTVTCPTSHNKEVVKPCHVIHFICLKLSLKKLGNQTHTKIELLLFEKGAEYIRGDWDQLHLSLCSTVVKINFCPWIWPVIWSWLKDITIKLKSWLLPSFCRQRKWAIHSNSKLYFIFKAK